MFWQKSKLSLFLFLCSGFFCLESRPQRLYPGELDQIIAIAQRREVQLFLLSDSSIYISSLTDYDIQLLSKDICVRTLPQHELNALFSFERAGNKSHISLVCLRFPTREEEDTGFSSFRMTFVEDYALANLVKEEGSLLEAFRVFHLIRE